MRILSSSESQAPPPGTRGADLVRIQDGETRGDDQKAGLQEESGGSELQKPNQHSSPSLEGSLIWLLAGLLTLVSLSWPPFPILRAGSVALLASPPRSQWRGRPGLS